MISRFKNIPKQAFFYWGNSPLSYINYLTLVTFKRWNPGWKTILCRPEVKWESSAQWSEHMQKVPYVGSCYAGQAEQLVDEVRRVSFWERDAHDVHMADYLRQTLMADEGGAWFDMDVLSIRPLEAMPVSDDMDLLVCWAGDKPGGRYWSTGIVLARPGTTYYKMLRSACKGMYTPKQYQCMGPDLVRAMFASIKSVEDAEPGARVCNVPMHVFYPYHYRDLSLLYQTIDESHIKDDTVAVHWYGGAELSMHFKNKYQESTIHKWDGVTMGRLIRRACGEI